MAELGEVDLAVVDLQRIAFEVSDDVAHHEVFLHGAEGEGNLLCIAERVWDPDGFCGAVCRCVAEGAPVSQDLFQEILAGLGLRKADHFLQCFGGLGILLAVQENLHELIPGACIFAGTHQLAQAGDELVILAEGETFYAARQPGDGFRFRKVGDLEDAIPLFGIWLVPPAVGGEGVDPVVVLAELPPFHFPMDALFGIDA